MDHAGSEPDSKRLIETLRQHQFELRAQNEELKRTYDELDRVTEQYRSLWSSAPIGYVTLERNGIILTANQRARDLLSLVHPITPTSTLSSFLDDNSRVILRQHLWSVSVAGNPVPVELRLATEAPTTDRWVQVESSVSDDGEYRTAVIDITARRTAEARQEALAGQLRQTQKMEALHELSAGIVHDFNNLLQVIISSGQMVRDEITAAALSPRNIDNLMRGAASATALTRRLLAFSRKTPLHTEEVSLGDVVDETIAIVRSTVPENIEIQLQLNEAALVCEIDDNLIEQALLNLCLNARDAMPNGGVLSLSTDCIRLEVETTVGGSQLLAGDYAVFTVRDSGIGMNHETQSRVFEPFFTTKSSKGDERGTGLGLAIVYGIIRQHRGAISVASELGHGSEFQVYLPLCDSTEPTPKKSPETAAAQPRVAGAKLLLAEDRDPVRLVIAWMLRDAGYEVVEASDGGEAVSIINEGRDIDLLLTDAIMPVQNGKAVCRRFHEKYPNLPAVFLTGHGDGIIDPEFVQEHELAVLGKPIQRERLLSVIGQRLRDTKN